MKKLFFILMLCMAVGTVEARKPKVKTQLFPDGTPIPAWFGDTSRVDVNLLGKRYALTDYGVKTDSNLVQTEAIQAVIDKAAAEGGGVVVVPKGTFLSGSLFFKQGTHLLVEEGARLKGSDSPSSILPRSSMPMVWMGSPSQGPGQSTATGTTTGRSSG